MERPQWTSLERLGGAVANEAVGRPRGGVVSVDNAARTAATTAEGSVALGGHGPRTPWGMSPWTTPQGGGGDVVANVAVARGEESGQRRHGGCHGTAAGY